MRAWSTANVAALVALVLLTAVGGGLRADAASSPSRYQSVDERAYARLARNLARDGRYGDRTMKDPVHWPPGAPAVFALAHELRPRATDGRWDVPSAYPVQAAFATALIPAAFVLAVLLGGAVAGVAAAAAVALYPPLVSTSGDLLTEPLGALMLTCSLIAVVLALRRPSVVRCLAAGALLGLAALVRADLVLLPFGVAGLAVLLLWRGHGGPVALRAAAAIVLATVAVVAPWSLHASSEAGRFVPISSGGASNLFVGTFVPGDGTMFGLKRELGFRSTVRQTKVLDRVAERYPRLDRDAALREAARENVRRYVVGDPGAFAAMGLRKVERLWLHYSVGTHRNERDWILAWHRLLVLLSAAGLIGGLAVARRPALWVVALALVYVTGVNVVLVSEARHNLPFLPVLFAGGAAGLCAALQRPRLTAAMRPGGSLVSRS